MNSGTSDNALDRLSQCVGSRSEQNMDEQRPTAANAIEIRIEKIAQLFHSLDPFPFREKDLDNDVEEFIVGWARELPPDKPLRLLVHLPATEASTPEAQEVGAAITQYFVYPPPPIPRILTHLFPLRLPSISLAL